MPDFVLLRKLKFELERLTGNKGDDKMLKDIITTAEAEKSFFPTPLALADKLLEGIDWDYICNVLEPSAGKGDLLKAIAARSQANIKYAHELNVDCIEFDPYLRQLLQYEFGGQRLLEIRERLAELEKRREWNCRTGARGSLSAVEVAEKRALEQEKEQKEKLSCHIVHDNFLTFVSRKRYQLIVMNPPFAEADAHLLKAIEVLSPYGGQIRCLLNAETILNPYTYRRQVLKNKLAELEAEVSIEEKAFAQAERPTDVAVAIVKIDLPTPQRESNIFEGLRAAAQLAVDGPTDVTDLTVQDFLERLVSFFNVEVDAGIELIREYQAMRPYILNDFSCEDSLYNDANLTLCVGRGQTFADTDINKYLKLTRKKYWRALFANKDFVGRLTSNLRKEYSGAVEQMADYDFTVYNIQQLNIEMNAKMRQGIEDTILALFDKLTQQYAWYPECAKNIHYYNGWQTNKVHKINNKVILPIHGIFSDYSWAKTFDVRQAESTISDIEKVFDYLDGNMTALVNLHGVLQKACQEGQTRNIPCKYFDVTLYKKGTMHIKFRSKELVDRFNIYCCQHKNWLPPSYGKKQYREMSKAEQAVVDEFHGDGKAEAGEAAYQQVMAQAAYYLAEPVADAPLLLAK